MIIMTTRGAAPGNDTNIPTVRSNEGPRTHDIPPSIRILFDDSPLDPVSYPRKAAALLAVLVFLSNATMIGAWVYFKISDLWMSWAESSVPLESVNAFQALVSVGAGAVVFAALFLIVLLANVVAFGRNRIWPREVDVAKTTMLQFGFSPPFGAVVLAAHLVTRTSYYDQGLAFVPLSLIVVYFAWFALMGMKIRGGMAAIIGKRGKAAGNALVIYAVVIGILFLLILLVALPAIADYPADWVYRVIF